MHAFGWMIADPICSMFIAVMIALSVLGLIKDSMAILMQRQPKELDRKLPQCYQQVARLEGVRSVQVNIPMFIFISYNYYVIEFLSIYWMIFANICLKPATLELLMAYGGLWWLN